MKNYAYKLAGEIGVRLLSTIFLLVLARLVGSAQFGVYSTAFAFASVFLIFVDLGTNPIVTREIARAPDRRGQIVEAVNFLKALTAAFMLLCLWACVYAIKISPDKTRLIHWFGWVVIGTAFTEYYSAVLTGVERMGSEAVLKIVTKGVVILAALLVLLKTHDLYQTVRTMGAFSIVSILAGALILRSRIGSFGFRPDWPYLKGLLKLSLPIFGSLAFLVMYDSQDILILNYFKVADHNIGLFALAVKIIDVLKIFPVLLASTFFPSLARHAHLSRKSFVRRSHELFVYAGIGFPILTAGIYALAPTLIQALYGRPFLEAVPALRWLLLGFLLMAFNIILLQLLIALDREKESLLGSALVCLSNLGLSALWVPRFGILGTCYALLASEVLYLIAQSYLVVRAYESLAEGPATRRADPIDDPLLSIIIPTYNTRDLTVACLHGIRRYPPAGRYEVIVVDNNSGDRTFDEVRRLFPDVKAVRNSGNLGFARACNRGAQLAHGDYFLFLNSDTEPLEGTFDILINWVKNHPQTAVVGPELWGPVQTMIQMSWSWDPLLGAEILQRYFAHPNIRHSRFKQRLIRHLQRKPRAVPFICGACMLIRRSVFDELEGFDETFELYFEDSDLCRRCVQVGWDIEFIPQAKVIHHLGQSTKGAWNMPSLIYQQSHITYYRKHAPWSMVFLKAYLVLKWVRIWVESRFEKSDRSRARTYSQWYLRMIFGSLKVSLDDRLVP
jgi:O-antigen/teichoic acid export membrane protein/GT2 family glycosyltransferase